MESKYVWWYSQCPFQATVRLISLLLMDIYLYFLQSHLKQSIGVVVESKCEYMTGVHSKLPSLTYGVTSRPSTYSVSIFHIVQAVGASTNYAVIVSSRCIYSRLISPSNRYSIVLFLHVWSAFISKR